MADKEAHRKIMTTKTDLPKPGQTYLHGTTEIQVVRVDPGIVDETDVDVMSVEEVRRERARVERSLNLRYMVHPTDLERAIRHHELPDGDELVEEWLMLDGLLRCVDDDSRRGGAS